MAIRFPSAQISVTLTCDVAPEEPRSGAGWRGGRHNKAQDGSALSFTVVVYRVIGLVSQQPSRRHDEYKKKHTDITRCCAVLQATQSNS